MASGAYERVLLGIAIAVAAVWVVAQIVQIVSPEHLAPDSVNTVMITVAGAFFGGSVISAAVSSRRERERDRNGGGDDTRH